MTLDEQCRDYERRFPEHFERLVGEWSAEGDDAFWLIRHASYLFRTGGVHWGIDLTLRTNEMLDYTEDRAGQALAPLRFVLTTHFHSDHFNKRLCAQLKGDEALWIVPDFAPAERKKEIIQAHDRVRFVKSGDKLELGGHRIMVLPGHHFDDGTGTGIESCGYAVETPDKKLFFPGDVRDFRTRKNVDYPGADHLFAHVWLGRCMALKPMEETYLEPYAAYLAGSNARHIWLTHLNNYSREPEDMWNEQHALAVQGRLNQLNLRILTDIPGLGIRQSL